MAKKVQWGYEGAVVLNSHKPFFGALTVLIMILAVTWFVNGNLEKQYNEDQRAMVFDKLDAARARLEGSLNERLFTVKGLSAYVLIENDPNQVEFTNVARSLILDDPIITSIQLAPNSVVRYVYPIGGNEEAVGHDLLADPSRRDAVKMAIENQKFVVAGPYELRQGGVGLIGRAPIFLRYVDREEYWGLGIIVLDFRGLMEDAGIYESFEKTNFAIRGIDGRGADGEVFFGSPAIFYDSPEVTTVSLPSGSWQMAAVPVGGWRSQDPWVWLVGALIAFLVACVVYRQMAAKEILKRSVQQATRELNEKTGELNKRNRQLEKIRGSLEKTVSDRTKTLDKKNKELERMLKFMVGRELRVKELKEELKKHS